MVITLVDLHTPKDLVDHATKSFNILIPSFDNSFLGILLVHSIVSPLVAVGSTWLKSGVDLISFASHGAIKYFRAFKSV